MADDGEKTRPQPESDDSDTRGGGRSSSDETSRQASDDERLRQAKEELKRLRVVDVVRGVMVDLMAIGYEKLGLTDETRTLRNLDDVRVAIESLRRLIEVLDGEGLADDTRTFRSTLATLQLAYARVAADEGTPARPTMSQDETDSQGESETGERRVADKVTEGAGPGSTAGRGAETDTVERAPRPATKAGKKKPAKKSAQKPAAKGAARKRRTGGSSGRGQG